MQGGAVQLRHPTKDARTDEQIPSTQGRMLTYLNPSQQPMLSIGQRKTFQAFTLLETRWLFEVAVIHRHQHKDR